MKTKVAEESSKKGFSKMILPLYLVLSALFIVYVAYGYLQGVVYNQGTTTGQQQGYEIAIIKVMNQVSEKCEPVALTAGETQVDIINVACLQQAPVADTVSEVGAEVMAEEK